MDHGSNGKFSPKRWRMSDLKSIVNKWQTFMYTNHGWNALYLENHDQARTVSRWASDKPEFRELAAKMFATFLCLQSGTVFVYQGQELGMKNMPEEWDIQEYRDLETLNHWEEYVCLIMMMHIVYANLIIRLKEKPDITEKDLVIAKHEYHKKSRDHARTPVQVSTARIITICSSSDYTSSVGRVAKCRLHDRYAVDPRQRRLRKLQCRSPNHRSRQRFPLLAHSPKPQKRIKGCVYLW